MKKRICFIIFVLSIQTLISQNIDALKCVQSIFKKQQYYFDILGPQEESDDFPTNNNLFYIDHNSEIKNLGNSYRFENQMSNLFKPNEYNISKKNVTIENSYLVTMKNSLLIFESISNDRLLSITIDLKKNLLQVEGNKIFICERWERVNYSEMQGIKCEIDLDTKPNYNQKFPIDEFSIEILKIKNSNNIYIEIKADKSFSEKENHKIYYRLLSSSPS